MSRKLCAAAPLHCRRPLALLIGLLFAGYEDVGACWLSDWWHHFCTSPEPWAADCWVADCWGGAFPVLGNNANDDDIIKTTWKLAARFPVAKLGFRSDLPDDGLIDLPASSMLECPAHHALLPADLLDRNLAGSRSPTGAPIVKPHAPSCQTSNACEGAACWRLPQRWHPPGDRRLLVPQDAACSSDGRSGNLRPPKPGRS